jgi:Arc/MetJ-type ribon-helix-helix transcriptional regulator
MVTKFPPQLEEDIQNLMASVEYDNATDILAQGVRLLARRRERAQRLAVRLPVPTRKRN